jgi:hypothetical protein
MVSFVLLILLLVAGLGVDVERQAREKPPPPPPAGNVTLYVSNQSFDRSPVDIRVEIDGREVVRGDFAVEDQHNWVEYTLRLEPGRHTVRARSHAGDAVLEKTLLVRGRTWVVVDYWCCGEPNDPRFTFYASRKPIGFA